MTEINKKKNRLRPTQYDEVSLVDSGANQDAHVLIYKRQDSGNKSEDLKSMNEHRLELGRAATKKKSSSTSSTGRKRGTTQRAKNWKEERHPRNKKGSGDPSGEFKETSSDSKKKYGKGGTTKAKLAGKKKSAGKGGSYKVKQGDTLWGLAEKFLGDGRRWKELGKQVGITTDAQARKLQIGTKISLPGSKKADAKKKTSGKSSPAKSTKTDPKKSTTPKKRTRTLSKPVLSSSRGHTLQEVGAEKYAKYKAKGWAPLPGDSSGRLYSPSALKTYNERLARYNEQQKSKTTVKKNDLLSQWMEG